MNMIIYIVLLGMTAPGSSSQDGSSSHVSEVYTVECRKPVGTRGEGCTADASKTFKAPSGFAIDTGSIRVRILNGWNRSKRMDCRYEAGDTVNVSVTLLSGRTVNITAPTMLTVFAHSESGSGYSNMGKRSFVDCGVDYDIFPLS